jgi:hypothetical protein
MRHLDAQARLAITAAMHDDMKSALREVKEDDHVVIPFHAQIARAERGRTYMSGTPRFGARQDLATELTEITEGGGLVFYARCALCALWLNPDLGVPGI